MGEILALFNRDAEISLIVPISCKASRGPVWSHAHIPRENPGIGIIVEQLTQSLCGKIFFSHEAPSMLIGQKPADICRVVRASSFYAICRVNAERLTEARGWYTDLRTRVNSGAQP